MRFDIVFDINTPKLPTYLTACYTVSLLMLKISFVKSIGNIYIVSLKFNIFDTQTETKQQKAWDVDTLLSNCNESWLLI